MAHRAAAAGIGFMAGVADNLVGLVYIAAAEGRCDEALAEEAGSIAGASGARNIARQVEEGRARL